MSKRTRYEVLRRDNFTCRYCGGSAPEVRLTVDHVIPRSLNGSNDPSNLIAACADCNAGKSSSQPDAALIDDVAQKALEWSAAIRRAALRMHSDATVRNEITKQFQQDWNCHVFEHPHLETLVAPLPDGWRASIIRFLIEMELPDVILDECVTISMENTRVSIDDKFKYMCGVAWKKIEQIQNEAFFEVKGAVE